MSKYANQCVVQCNVLMHDVRITLQLYYSNYILSILALCIYVLIEIKYLILESNIVRFHSRYLLYLPEDRSKELAYIYF